MGNDHPLLSPKIVVVFALLGGSALGMSLILAERLTVAGLAVCVLSSCGMFWLYWEPVRVVFSTTQWPDAPSKAELTIASLCPVVSFLLALYLFLQPASGPSSLPHVPTAQENAAAIVARLESERSTRIGALQFTPDLPIPPVTVSIPQTEYFPIFIRQKATTPIVSPPKINPFSIGKTAIGQSAIGGLLPPLTGNNDRFLGTDTGALITTENGDAIEIASDPNNRGP